MQLLSFIRQFTAAGICSLLVLCAGSGYAWPAALIEKLQKPDSEIRMTPNELALMVSLMEISNVITPVPSAYFCDMFGRKITLLLSAPMFCVAGIITLTTRSVYLLYTMRILTGLANGIVFTVVPIYLGEVSEPKYRGACSIFFTAFFFLGMLITYIVGKFGNYNDLSWVITIEPVVFSLLFIFMPETPHYYLLNSKKQKAQNSLQWLRGTKDSEDIAPELKHIFDEVKVIPAIPLHSTEQIRAVAKNPWKELFLTKAGKRSLALGTLVAATQVIGGFFSVFCYTVETVNAYRDENSVIDGDYLSMIITITTLLVTILAVILVDIMGRRPMLLISGSIAFFSSSFAASFYFLTTGTTVKLYQFEWMCYISLVTLASGLNFALGALMPTLQAELFSTQTRGLASSLLVMLQCGISSLILYIYLPIQNNGGVYLNFVIFAIATSLGTCLIYLFFPETKGKSFAEILDMLT